MTLTTSFDAIKVEVLSPAVYLTKGIKSDFPFARLPVMPMPKSVRETTEILASTSTPAPIGKAVGSDYVDRQSSCRFGLLVGMRPIASPARSTQSVAGIGSPTSL